MIPYLIDALIFAGSALMVFNIFCFVRFAVYIRGMKTWKSSDQVLFVPIILLVFFLIGYLVIVLFGKPDLMMAGVLFGGSVFVQIMYRILYVIVQRVIESERLEAQLMVAEESNRARSGFLASISHEMRTPMNVIVGMDTLALKNPSLSPETRDQLEKIGYSARHLSGLINNLLDIQGGENHTEGTVGERLSLKETLEQINAVFSVSCQEKGLTWQTSIDWDLAADYIGDAAQLKRALMNILDNAVKFTDAPGNVRFTATGTIDGEEKRELSFVVQDTGIGIDESFLPKVFEAFSQEDGSTTNRFGGSGVGLAVSHTIIAQMGGKIEVSSRKGEGSVFTVTIPAAFLSSAQKAAEEVRKESVNYRELLGGCRILIVDDIEENAEIVSDLLELEGVESDHALNGQIALDVFAASEEYVYDAVLMDLRMPVMDGLEATRRIRAMERADAKTIPIIALSANAYETDVRNSLDAGMNSHLAKPADADELYAELARWIRKTEPERSTEKA